jgi:hypothetical protein
MAPGERASRLPPRSAPRAGAGEPLLALIGSAPVQGGSAHSGEPDEKIGRRRDAWPDFVLGELCSEIDGFNLHARTVIAADGMDRVTFVPGRRSP